MELHDPLAALFLICFAVGAILIVLAFVGGVWALPFHMTHGHVDFPLHHADVTDVGSTHAGSAPTHTASGSNGHSASPFNTLSVLTFFTWFGGIGFILRTNWSATGWAVVLVATTAGLIAGGALFLLLARVLLPQQRFLDPSDFEMVGTVARVTVGIRERGTGEIVYTKGGTRHTDAARAEGGGTIERGVEVVVVRFEHGIAFVEPWARFIERSEIETTATR